MAERHYRSRHLDQRVEEVEQASLPEAACTSNRDLEAVEHRMHAALQEAGYSTLSNHTNPRYQTQFRNLPSDEALSTHPPPPEDSHLCIDPHLLSLSTLVKHRTLTLRQRLRYGMIFAGR